MADNIEDNGTVVTNILLWRIYDALTLILRNENPAEADAMVRTHEKGLFITAPPSINMEE